MKRLSLGLGILIISILFIGCGSDKKFIGEFQCKNNFNNNLITTYIIKDNHKANVSMMGIIIKEYYWTKENDNMIKMIDQKTLKSIFFEYKDDNYILGVVAKCKKVK